MSTNDTGFAIGRNRRKVDEKLRKQMMISALNRLDQNADFSQTQLAQRIGVSQSIISKWNNLNESVYPSFADIIRVCNELGFSLNDLFQDAYPTLKDNIETDVDKLPPNAFDFVSAYLKSYGSTSSADETYDNSSAHLKRLVLYANHEYVGLYLPHENEKESKTFNVLNITTSSVDERGFCPFSMYINDKKDHPYFGKIISSFSSFHAYFYLAGGEPIERGIWMLYHPTRIQDEYLCGHGVILSIDKTVWTPSFQRIIMIKKEHYKPEFDEQLKEILQDTSKFEKKETSDSENNGASESEKNSITFPLLLYSTLDEYRETHDKLYSIIFPNDQTIPSEVDSSIS